MFPTSSTGLDENGDMGTPIRSFRRLGTTACFLATATAIHADVSGGYLYHGSNEVDYLTVTESGQNLSGYIQSVTENTSQAAGYTVRNLPFDGEISGSTFTVRSGNLGICSGEYGSGVVKIYFPTASGQTNTLEFAHSTPDQWNEIVASFEKNCFQDALRQSWREVIQAHFTELRDENTRADRDTERTKQAQSRANEVLAQLADRMAAANDRLDAAHKERDATQLEADKAKELAREAQADSSPNRKSQRGFMGVNLQDLSEPQRARTQLPGGALIQRATPGGPAASAGIRAGDVVIRIDKWPILGQADFLYAMLKHSPGQTAKVEIVRTGRHETVSVRLADPPTQSMNTASNRASTLSYASGQAEYRVGQADYVIGTAEYTKNSVQAEIDRVNGELTSDSAALEAASQLQAHIRNESTVLASGTETFKMLGTGSLWVATTTQVGNITAWPEDDSQVRFQYQAGQPLSIVPVSSEWCMAMLQNKTIGWIQRRNLTIRDAEPNVAVGQTSASGSLALIVAALLSVPIVFVGIRRRKLNRTSIGNAAPPLN